MQSKQFITLIAVAITLVADGRAQLTSSLFDAKLSEQVQVLPFVFELQTVKFKPHESDVPDELRVTFTDWQFEIAGVKKSEVKVIKGRRCGHLGKLALFKSASPQSGTLQVKIPSIKDTTYYGLSLDCTNGILLSKPITLAVGNQYDWSAKQDGTDFVLEVKNGGETVDSVRANASTVKGFGFFATARFPMSKADIIVTVKPPDPKGR